MKRLALFSLAAVTLVACQDQPIPSEPPIEQQRAAFPPQAATEAQIAELINALFNQPEKREAHELFAQVKRGMASGDEDLAQAKAGELAQLAWAAFSANRVNDPDGNGPLTPTEGVLELTELVFAFAGVLIPPEFDEDLLTEISQAEDFVVAVVPPSGGTVLTEKNFAGVDISDEALDQTIVVTIQKIVQEDRCLPTGLIQSEGCWEYNRFPAGDFNVDVEVAVCVEVAAAFDPLFDLFRLHKFAPGQGVEVLVVSPGDIGVECATFTALNSPGSNGLRHFASALTGRLAALLGPQPLFASALISRPKRLSGTGTSFTDFGGAIPVDVAISAGNNQTAGVGTAVPIDPTVHVTDSTGADLEGVAIIWLPQDGSVSQDTVLTDSDGLASVIWTLGVEGTNTLIATTAAQGDSVTFTATGENRILIYGPSMQVPTTFRPKNEQTFAEEEGFTVTVADATTWSGFSTAEFAAFNAIVFGDIFTVPGDFSPLAAAEANKTVWSAAITGPIIVSGFNPQRHQCDLAQTNCVTGPPGPPVTPGTAVHRPEAPTLIKNAINFAAGGTGTGLYASLSRYFQIQARTPLTSVSFLSEVGDFKVAGIGGVAADTVTIVATTHPAMVGLTNAGLSDWFTSVHQFIVDFPESFIVLAEALRTPGPGQETLPGIIATPGGTP